MSSCGRSKEILNDTIVSSLQQSLMKSSQMSSNLIPSKIISSNSVSTKNHLFLFSYQTAPYVDECDVCRTMVCCNQVTSFSK